MSDDELARARRSWRLAEAHLYPMAMTNVDGYQRALVLVAAVRELLRERAETAAELVGLERDAAHLLAEASDSSGVSPAGLDVDDVFGSAAAARDRECAGEERRRARLAALTRAIVEGEEWTDIHTEELGPRVPELRVHVPTGRVILTATGFDDEQGAPVLQVTTARLDIATGELLDDPAAEVRQVTSAGEWAALAAELQRAGGRLP
jgi:hypothetical protein